jgi:hypothetical protein
MHDPFEGGSALPVEMEEKWPRIVRELSGLVSHLKDMRLKPNEKPLPQELSHVEKNRLLISLVQAALAGGDKKLKGNVIRRVADRIGDYFLWNRTASFPVIHELITLLAWRGEKIPVEAMNVIRDLAMEFTIRGQVVPVQNVWMQLLDSPVTYMGHCVCRSSGLVYDLTEKGGRVFMLTTPEQSRLLLDRLMARHDSLVKKYGVLPQTDEKFIKLFAKLNELKKSGSELYRLETLLRRTYGTWEFLPVLDSYTQSWIRGLQKNRKAFMLHKALAVEMANIFYLSHGCIFTSMKCVDTPYTICSCPSPDTGGGCALTNWHYYGMSGAAIAPNKDISGRRTDEAGSILPCNLFPERAGRECLGCGCKHAAKAPRSMETVLSQADEVISRYGEF